MKVRRYDHRVRRGRAFPGQAFAPAIEYAEGSSYITGRVARYTKVGSTVTVMMGGRMSLRQKRSSAWHRAKS